MDKLFTRIYNKICNFVRKISFVNELGSILFPKLIAEAATCITGYYSCYDHDCGTYCTSKIVGAEKYCYFTEWHLIADNPGCNNAWWCADPCLEGCWETTCPTCPCYM